MTTDLWMLAGSAALAWLLIVAAAAPKLFTNGLAWAAGNRDESGEAPAWVARAGRAHANLQENLIIFAALVLVVHVSGSANDASALGATIFFIARCAHALIYVLGVPWVRTLAWVVSLVGMFIVGAQLL